MVPSFQLEALEQRLLLSASSLTGDLNGEGAVDGMDIDMLRSVVVREIRDPRFDLDGIGGDTADEADFDFLLEFVLGSARGESDLNGVVDFSDFVVVSNQFNKMNTAGQGATTTLMSGRTWKTWLNSPIITCGI